MARFRAKFGAGVPVDTGSRKPNRQRNMVEGQIFEDGKIEDEKITNEKITNEKITEEKITEEKITEEKIGDEKIGNEPNRRTSGIEEKTINANVK